MTSVVIAVIGAGNMGASLIGGLIKNRHPADQLIAADPDQHKLKDLQQRFGIQIGGTSEACAKANVVILAVKPQSFSELADEIRESIQIRNPLILSVIAGLRLNSIQQSLGGNLAIVRTMPNTPALIGCGATGLFANEIVTPAQHQQAEDIMQAVGEIEWLNNENLLDIVTALSGSGPAYFFLVMEAMQQAAIELGLPEKTAHALTLQTALGAARMAQTSERSLADLRRSVTSPGGTTEKAISVLEENNLHDIFRKAINGAKLRSEELAQLNK